MKKLLSLLIAAMLCISFSSACAEDSALASGVFTPPDTGIAEFPPFDASHMAYMSGSHSVTVTDRTVTVAADNLRFCFDYVAAGDGYVIWTQNRIASAEAYSMYNAQLQQSVYDLMIQHNLYMYMRDLYSDTDFYIMSSGSDAWTMWVHDLRDLSAQDLKVAAGDLRTLNCNGTPWFIVNSASYLTVVNSQYIYFMSSENLGVEEATLLLSALDINAAW